MNPASNAASYAAAAANAAALDAIRAVAAAAAAAAATRAAGYAHVSAAFHAADCKTLISKLTALAPEGTKK